MLQRRFEEKSHARRVVDADGAVHITAVGEVHKDHVQGLAVMALEAVELTGFVVKPPIQKLFFPIPLGIGGDEGLGRSAPGAILDQKDFAPTLRRGGRNQLLAGVTE